MLQVAQQKYSHLMAQEESESDETLADRDTEESPPDDSIAVDMDALSSDAPADDAAPALLLLASGL
jgi:hypothetical protein